MKAPRHYHIHGVSALAKIVAIVIGWQYLPPYLLNNPGVWIIAGALLFSDVLFFCFPR